MVAPYAKAAFAFGSYYRFVIYSHRELLGKCSLNIAHQAIRALFLRRHLMSAFGTL